MLCNLCAVCKSHVCLCVLYLCLSSSQPLHFLFLLFCYLWNMDTHTQIYIHMHTCTTPFITSPGPWIIISAVQGQGDAAGKLKSERSAEFDLSVLRYLFVKVKAGRRLVFYLYCRDNRDISFFFDMLRRTSFPLTCVTSCCTTGSSSFGSPLHLLWHNMPVTVTQTPLYLIDTMCMFWVCAYIQQKQ